MLTTKIIKKDDPKREFFSRELHANKKLIAYIVHDKEFGWMFAENEDSQLYGGYDTLRELLVRAEHIISQVEAFNKALEN